MSDTYDDIPDIESGELYRPIPTYDKDKGKKEAEKYRKEYLEMFEEEPSKERLEIIRNSYIYIGDKYK